MHEMESFVECGIGSILCTPLLDTDANADEDRRMNVIESPVATRQPMGINMPTQSSHESHLMDQFNGSSNSSLVSSQSSSLSGQDCATEFLGDRVVIARPGLVVVRGGCRLPMSFATETNRIFLEGIEINTVVTSNPLVIRFYPNMPVLECISEELTFCCKSRCFSNHSPLVAKLLQLNGIEEITLTPEYIAIKKTCHEHANTQSQMLCSVSWRNIKPKILAILLDYFASGKPIVEKCPFGKPPTPFLSIEDSSHIIKDLIESRIRPFVKQEGGDVIFIEYRRLDHTVFVSLSGTCVSSPNATKILKNVILQLLQFYVPGVENIVEVSTPHHKDIR